MGERDADGRANLASTDHGTVMAYVSVQNSQLIATLHVAYVNVMGALVMPAATKTVLVEIGIR